MQRKTRRRASAVFVLFAVFVSAAFLFGGIFGHRDGYREGVSAVPCPSVVDHYTQAVQEKFEQESEALPQDSVLRLYLMHYEAMREEALECWKEQGDNSRPTK